MIPRNSGNDDAGKSTSGVVGSRGGGFDQCAVEWFAGEIGRGGWLPVFLYGTGEIAVAFPDAGEVGSRLADGVAVAGAGEALVDGFLDDALALGVGLAAEKIILVLGGDSVNVCLRGELAAGVGARFRINGSVLGIRKMADGFGATKAIQLECLGVGDDNLGR